MKAILILILIALSVGCRKEVKHMSTTDLPRDWTAGEIVPDSQIYSDPPKDTDPSRTIVYGYIEGDSGHRFYLIPADTPVAEVVRVFAVGSHAERSYGDDATETVELVAAKASRIAEMIPCHAVFADPAGLKLRFERQVRDDDLGKIEALFTQEEMMQAGLERYVSEWEEGRPLLESVKQENLFHFWWD